MATSNLSASRLREALEYDPNTGLLKNRSSGLKIGSQHSRGYIQAHIFGETHLVHRLVWLYMHGKWPTKEIDHINGDRSDNRLTNLREANTSENAQNRKKRADNTSGFTGVRPHQSAWRADIKLNGKYKFIGSYETPELAHAAYLAAKTRVHPFQPVPRIS